MNDRPQGLTPERRERITQIALASRRFGETPDECAARLADRWDAWGCGTPAELHRFVAEVYAS
jgi:hypothetical protein